MSDQNIVIQFKVPGVPVSQPRQRHRICTGGGKTIACNYTPSRHPVNDYKAAIKILAASQHSGSLLDGPLRVWITAVFAGPKSKCKKSGNERMPKTSKPDIDNICKSIFDALNGVVWNDDSQVASLIAAKDICGDGEEPHTLVAIARI